LVAFFRDLMSGLAGKLQPVTYVLQ